MKIATNYPTHAQATIEMEDLPADVAVKVRVPSCVRKPKVKQTRDGEKVQIAFRGESGHRIEQCHPGVMVTYGPLGVDSRGLVGPLASPRGRRCRGPGRLYSASRCRREFPRSNSIAGPTPTGLSTCQPVRPSVHCRNGAISTRAPRADVGRGIGRRSAIEISFGRSAAGAFYADVLQHVESFLVRDAGGISRRSYRKVAWPGGVRRLAATAAARGTSYQETHRKRRLVRQLAVRAWIGFRLIVKGKHRLMRRKREVEPGDRLGIPHGWKVVATWAIVGLSIRPAALAAGESVPAGMTSVRTP